MTASKALQQLKTILQSTDTPASRAVAILVLGPQLTRDAVQTIQDAIATAEPIVQVALMDVYFDLTGDKAHEQDLERLLSEAAKGGDDVEEVYMAARLALGKINGRDVDSLDPSGEEELEVTAIVHETPGEEVRQDPSITIMIHGTWAADGKWWRPQGNFFEYVKSELDRQDLYGQDDLFMWSGKNRDSKRQQAADSLNRWILAHPAAEINVFAHSHGANVAMLATRTDMRIDRLVMLSPPVRPDYFANWDNVGHAFNIQASSDPVVAIARGGQWFRLPNVFEKRMEASGHSSSHEPDVWRRENLASFIGMPWL